jgi:maltose O-acetyltransferase
MGRNAILAAKSVAQRDVPDHHIAVGQPAKSVKIKPEWEDAAEPLDADVETDKESRHIEDRIPDDLEIFDEFQRDLDPPGEE